jgi:hypothetical protein
MANRARAGYGDYDDIDEYFRDEYRAEQGAYAERRPAYERYGRENPEPRFWGPRLPVDYRMEEDFARSGTGAPLNAAADRFYVSPDRDVATTPARYPSDRTVARPERRSRETRHREERHRGAGLLGAAEHFYREMRESLDPRAEPDLVHGHHRGRGPRNYVRPDARILEDIHEHLTRDPFLDASEIEVDVKSREVTLSGLVANRLDKRRAEDIAEDVSGVLHVQNNLRVRP